MERGLTYFLILAFTIKTFDKASLHWALSSGVTVGKWLKGQRNCLKMNDGKVQSL